MTESRESLRRLSDERQRLVADSAAVRRAAASAMAVLTAVVIASGLVIGLLVHSARAVQRLNQLSQRWADAVEQVEAQSVLLLDEDYRRAAPEPLMLGYVAQLETLIANERSLDAQIDTQIAHARSPLIDWLPIVNDGDLREVEASELDPLMTAPVRALPERFAADPTTPETHDDATLRTSLRSHELSSPATQRERMTQILADESYSAFIRWLTVTLLVVFATVVFVWIGAFWPAMRALRQLTASLDSHAAELTHGYFTIDAAQQVAKLGYWFRRSDEEQIGYSAEFGRLIKDSTNPEPTSFADLAALSSPNSAAEATEIYQRLSSEAGAAEMSRTIPRPDREPLVVRERVQSIEVDGSLDIFGVMLDVSEITLAHQVISRMEKLEIIDLLVSGIAHDFNNLLAIVLGNTEMAKVTSGADRERHLAAIASACETASSLIEQLRETSNEPSGSAVRFRPAERIRQIAEALSPPCGVTLQTNIASEAADAVITSNRGLFESSLVNIVENAFDALSSVGGHVVITLRPAAPLADDVWVASRPRMDHRRLLVEVSDDGPGMSDEVRRRAVQPFFTTKSSSPDDHAGLGLWSVYSFAKAWGADIAIDSVVGRGTTVRLAFPYESDQSRPAADRSGEIPAIDGTVLLVEDEARLRDLLGEILRVKGIHVEACSTYADARAALHRYRDLALVISDVHLGVGQTGIDLATVVLAEPDPPAVVLISGAQRHWETPAALDTPLCTFLVKPCTSDHLANAITQVLLARRLRQAMGAASSTVVGQEG